jgi:tetratricopeptide (TPR) repeat protein
LFVYAEQGLGDEIMFAALLRPLLARGIAVTLMIDPRLEPLLARSLEGDLQFVHRGAKLNEDNFSHQCPMASLCEFFCTTEPSLKGLHPYLRPSEARVREMHEAIAAHRSDQDLLCGISWRSGGARSGMRRSMELNELLSKVHQPGMVFVNLQYGRCDEEILAAQAQLGVNVLSIPGLDTKADIDGLAALISVCDAVVSVDNTTVHLAGALGKPTHVLLAHNADWRWMRDRNNSPWYPSVRLHRSTHRQRWEFEKPIAIQALSPGHSRLLETSIKLHRQGELEKARPGYIEILKASPHHFDSLQLLGLIEKKQGRAAVALNLYNRALALSPTKAAVFNNKGNALRELKRFSEARDCFNQAIKLSPQYAEGFYNRGLTENDLAEFVAAERSFDEAIRLKPNYAEAWFDRGNALRHQYKFEPAIESYYKALELKTNYFEAYNNLGKVYQDLRQMDKALEFYNKALSIKPDYEAANWNKALYFLRLGDYPQGWQLFEWGLRNGQRGPALQSTRPLWTPERPFTDRVLCYSEQGLGDEIMFGVLLPELRGRCSSLSVIMDARLIPLFQRWLGKAVRFFPRGEKLSEADYDSQIAAGSLCQYFRPSEASFRNGPAYLKACPKRKREIKALLKPLRTPKRKLCGISWRSKGARSGRERSLTIAELVKKTVLTGYDFVSLQYDEQPGEVVAGGEETNETIFTCPSLDTFRDIEGVAALIQCCDLVVSVDNTTVHLAGALGTPTRVYLPYISIGGG